MLPDLYIIFFLNFPIIKSFQKVFIGYLIIDYFIVYSTIIILNTLDKVGNCIELEIV